MKKEKQTCTSDVVGAGIHVVRYVVKLITQDVREAADTALESVLIGNRAKPALRVDINAEDAFRRELHKYQDGRFKTVKVYGEESLQDTQLDLSAERGIVALVDAVDGTDLVERGLYNWCSAAVFFKPRNPEGRRLIAAFVGLPSGDVYYATNETETVLVKSNSHDSVRPVAGHSNVTSLEHASICFYGQKVENLLSVVQGAFVNGLKELQAKAKRSGKKLPTRLYDLAGIPMIVKLVDHRVSHARGIDAVFDLKGQHPHDFVPGAFLAKKAGAVMKDLDGKEITIADMEDLLLKPASSSKKYVLACTEQLCDALLALVGSKKHVVRQTLRRSPLGRVAHRKAENVTR